MLTHSLVAIFRRDLAALHREIAAYPDGATLWISPPPALNSGGALTRHLCGNLQHYIGAVLGQSGYRRNRDAEFNGPAWERKDLLAEVDATAAIVASTLSALADEALSTPFPVAVDDRIVETGDFLVHLAVHCAFHLGQIDYHRRLMTGASASVTPMGIKALASAVEG